MGSVGSPVSVNEAVLLGRRLVFDDGNAKEVRLSYDEVRFEDGGVREVSLSYKEVRFKDSERSGN